MNPAYPPEPPRPDGRGEIVVGLQADDVKGAYGIDIDSAEVHIKVDGAEVKTESWKPAEKAFPREFRVTAPEKSPTARVDVDVLAYPPEGMMGGPRDAKMAMIHRLASTKFTPKATKLMRLRLEQRCVNNIPIAGGAFFGPECAAPETCIAGRCKTSDFPDDELEPYNDKWATYEPDYCSQQGGQPEVVVGTGETDFKPITSGDTVTPVCGPQGGSHIWVSVQMKNLKQRGSATAVHAKQPDTGKEVQASAFVFSYERDGGVCKLTGLRMQFDNGGTAFQDFLGKPLDIIVDVSEGTKKATGTAHVNVAAALDDPYHRCGVN